MENNGEYFVPINEVVKRLDVPAYTLRYWEKQFAGAIRPTTGSGGRRYYRQDTIEKLQTIKSLLYDKGMTITGVKKILHNGSFCDEMAEVKNKIEPMQAKLQMSVQNKDDLEEAITLLHQAKSLLE
ncbi:MAG: MerR family transcriptional regulator [Alphaproteobacteria bacterium]|nr:MerR family transcriptional regulator [Alphaproteobacteria bacterium]